MTRYLLIGLAAINVLALLLMAVDKALAKKQTRRIPERILFLSAFLGGSVGAILGMWTFHHKTRHWYFALGMPLLLLVQLLTAIAILIR